MEAGRTPVFLLSGFLGSGKTTLLNALLKTPGFANTAVVVNEIGEIGLDHLLIARASDNVVLLDAGCLCCTIVDSLQETLADLNFRRVRGEVPAFERVIIETTGLADPGPILNILLGHRLVTDHYLLEAAVVTVDAQHAHSTLDGFPEAVEQVALADRLILTKRDLGAPSAALLARLDALNPSADRHDARDAQSLLAAFAPGAPHRLRGAFVPARPASGIGQMRAGAPPAAHATGVRADSFVLPGPTTWAGVAAWWRLASEHFGARLLRCKGLLEISDSGAIVFIQGVQRVFHTPERLPGWPDADHRSRIVCITKDADPAELRATLRAFDLPAGSSPELCLADLETPGRIT